MGKKTHCPIQHPWQQALHRPGAIGATGALVQQHVRMVPAQGTAISWEALEHSSTQHLRELLLRPKSATRNPAAPTSRSVHIGQTGARVAMKRWMTLGVA